MEKISVTRALVQLKRIDARLEKKTRELSCLVTVNKKKEKNVLNGTYTKEVFNKNAKAHWQSINDLIALRNEIKTAIVTSNATTIVTIAGKEYTVAEAIERKNFINNFENTLVNKINRVYSEAVFAVESKNEDVEADAQNLFGKSSEDKKSELNRLELMKSYIDMNSYEILDPVNLKELKDSMHKEVNDFLAEVNEVLTESNAITMVEISKKPSDIE